MFRRALRLLPILATLSLILIDLQLHSGSAAQPRAVRFRMEWVPSGMYAPFFLAVSEGYYSQNGLSVDMLNGNGSLSAIEDVTSGQSDLGLASCGALAIAISKGRPVVSVAQYMAKYSWGFYVPRDLAAKSVKDLAGKSVVMSPNSSEGVLLPALFEIAGMPQDAMRKIAVDPSQKVATYGRSQGDSVVTTAAYGEPIVQAVRPSKLLLWADDGFVMPDYCIFTRAETVKQDPALISAFLQGTFKGIAEAQKSPELAVDAVSKLRPIVVKDASRAQWEMTTRFLHSDNTGSCLVGWHAPKDWEKGLATLKKAGAIQGEIGAASTFYTNQFVKC